MREESKTMTTHPWILIVEDNPDEAHLVREAFAEAVPGIGTIVTTCASETLARLSGLGAEDWPRLLVTDRHLPDLNGEELIARIRAFSQAQAQALVIVMLSGGGSPPPGLNGVQWYEKPAMWSAWRALADSLAVRHLSGNH